MFIWYVVVAMPNGMEKDSKGGEKIDGKNVVGWFIDVDWYMIASGSDIVDLRWGIYLDGSWEKICCERSFFSVVDLLSVSNLYDY